MGNCPGERIVLVGNCPGGELSWWGIVLVRNCPGERIVLVGNCPG